jgi:uncharacterized protein (TIGR00251 family)
METILKAKILTGKKEFKVVFDNDNDFLIVQTTKRPEKGKANTEIVKELKRFFKSDVTIVSGLTSKEKKIAVDLQKEQILQMLENNTN